jgi:asparagine synthase (glutamine-hydrolysing)
MCGIYGVVARGAGGIDGAVLERMAGALVHRGPDGDGRVVRGPVSLGCRRLAIVDVAGGAQPLRNENDDVLVVCNGEIYNHAILRADLFARGHRFRTGSDAEVIPHLYEERGLGFLDALDGMFGLALWDARTGTLVLARDRLGEKPLFYSATPEGLLFASEATALLATGSSTAPPTEPRWVRTSAPATCPRRPARSPRSGSSRPVDDSCSREKGCASTGTGRWHRCSSVQPGRSNCRMRRSSCGGISAARSRRR